MGERPERHNISINGTLWHALAEEANARQRTVSNYIHYILARRSTVLPGDDMPNPTLGEQPPTHSSTQMPADGVRKQQRHAIAMPSEIVWDYENDKDWWCTRCKVTFDKALDACPNCGAKVPLVPPLPSVPMPKA